MAQRLILDDKAHRIMVRKSFLVSKLPLLIKKWSASFGTEKQFYDPFFNCSNIKNIHASYAEKDIKYLTDTSFNSIEKALYMTWLRCNNNNNHHFVLREIVNHCISLKIISADNIRVLINDSNVVDNEENEDVEIQKNYFSNFLEKNPVEYVVNLVIRPRYQAAVIKADFLDTNEHYFNKMDCLIRNPSVLDIIQLHGFIPDVLERVFIEMRNIFEAKEDSSTQHTKFALAFTLLYIISERFEFKKVRENREIFYMLMERHFINESALEHLKEWFQNWFEDRLDRFSESGQVSNICQDILKELFAVSNRITQAEFIGGEVNMEGILTLRKQYSPSLILKASTCMAKLFVEWYFLKPSDLELKLVPILSFFHEQFGYHVEVGFSAGLLSACLQTYPYLESTREKIPDFVEAIYKAFLAKNREVFGFNISSIMLHTLLVQCVHTCTQNNKSLERRKPVVYNYHIPTVQSLLHESYLITGSNIEWQLATQEDPQEHHGKVFLLPPLLGFGNTNVNLSSSASSAVVQTWVEHEFENIYRSLAVSSLTSLNTQGFIMKSTMRVSFNVLVRGYRAMGTLNFLKFLLDHIFECLLKEDEEPFDAIRVTEAAATMFFISTGEDGIETLLMEATNNGLFEFLLQHHHDQHKNFLETGVQIYNRPPNPKTPSVKGIQALSNVEYLYMLSSLFGYFTVFVLSLRERRLSNNEGIQKFILHLIEEHTHKIVHEEKHFMTHFTLSFFEQLSKIPNLIHQTQLLLKKQPDFFPDFCQIITRASIGNSFLFTFGKNLTFSDGLVLSLVKNVVTSSYL